MFERLTDRARSAAFRAAGMRRREIAARLAAELLPGASSQVEGEAVVISGQGLKRRYVLEPEVRAMLARVR